MSATCPRCGFQSKSRSIASHVWRCGVTREELFWHKVDKSAGPAACWPWKGAITSHGYGCFNLGPRGTVRIVGAHKAAYLFAKGEVPARMEIMHACDNPKCCNPAHLSLGTRQDNTADRVAKGRSHRLGYRRKLTDEQVVEIRSLRGKEGSGSVAKRFNISQPYVINLWNGRFRASACIATNCFETR